MSLASSFTVHCPYCKDNVIAVLWGDDSLKNLNSGSGDVVLTHAMHNWLADPETRANILKQINAGGLK